MENIKNAVEKHRQLIYDAEKFIWHHPETGYKEFVTSKYMEDTFRNMDYDLVCAEDLTGFYTRIDTGRPGPEVLVMADLDSLICPAHPDADRSGSLLRTPRPVCGHGGYRRCSEGTGNTGRPQRKHPSVPGTCRGTSGN